MTRASISQDYWGEINEDWGLGDGSPPAGSRDGTPVGVWGRSFQWSRGGAPVGCLGDEVPQKLKLFCETKHNICVKIQQTTLAVTRVDIVNDITSKILGRGDMSPCPIGIDAPCA